MFSEWKLGSVFVLSLWYYLTIPHGGLWYVHAHDFSQVVFGWGVLSFFSPRAWAQRGARSPGRHQLYPERIVLVCVLLLERHCWNSTQTLLQEET